MIKKFRFYTLAVIIFSSLILLNSCKKENEVEDNIPPGDDPVEEVTSENSIIIEEYNQELLSDSAQLGLGEYEYQFTGDIPEFSEGDIIVGHTGDGYLRKVTSVAIDGNNVILQTEQATLEELFENSNLSISMPVEQSSRSSETLGAVTEEIYRAKGVTVVDGEGINLSISDVEFKFGNDEESLSLKIVEAGINIVPNLEYDHDIEDWEVKKIGLTSYGTEFNFENSISISGELKETLEIDPINIFTAKTSRIVGYVYVSIIHKVYLKVEPSVNLGLDYNYNSNTNYTYDIGAIYDNGAFEPFFEKTWDNHTVVNNSLSVQAGGQIKLSLVYEPTLYIYGIKGPYLENSGYGEIKGAISTNGGWDLNMGFGIDSKVGLKYTIFKKNVLDVSKTYNWVETTGYVAPYDIEIIDGNNQTGNLSEPLPENIKVRVRSSTGKGVKNVKVYFVPETGSGTTSSEYELSDSDGFAEIEWTLGDVEVGTHELNVFAKKADGSYIKDSPVKFEATPADPCIDDVYKPVLGGATQVCDYPYTEAAFEVEYSDEGSGLNLNSSSISMALRHWWEPPDGEFIELYSHEFSYEFISGDSNNGVIRFEVYANGNSRCQQMGARIYPRLDHTYRINITDKCNNYSDPEYIALTMWWTSP